MTNTIYEYTGDIDGLVWWVNEVIEQGSIEAQTDYARNRRDSNGIGWKFPASICKFDWPLNIGDILEWKNGKIQILTKLQDRIKIC